MVKRYFLILVAVALMLFSLSSVFSASIWFNGTVKDNNGNPVGNVPINLTVRSMIGFTTVGYNSTTANASGWFNLNVNYTSGGVQELWVYELSIVNYTRGYCNLKSKTIPAFPAQMLTMLSGATFYLTSAGTINITAVNASGARNNFTYQIKDSRLGYPVAEEHTSQNIQEVDACVPNDRNYSIMLYPFRSMPVSFNWDNFSSPIDIRVGSQALGTNLSFYNATSKVLHKQFNLTMGTAWVTGYVNFSSAGFNVTGWNSFTVVPYLLEPGKMVQSQYGVMPYNLTSMRGTPQTDAYNLSSGYYNITLPTAVETLDILLFATVRNVSSGVTSFYGGFRNITSSYGTTTASFNFTLFPLMGSYFNITQNVFGQSPTNYNASTAQRWFTVVDSNNASFMNTSVHIETKVDYSSFASLGNNITTASFTWMIDVAQSQLITNFSIPLLNISGIKEMNVYVNGGNSEGGQYTPKTKTFTVSEIIDNSNITVKTFNPQGIDSALATSAVTIALYTSNVTCDVPNPPTTCLIGGSSQTMATFNPMRAIMGGGKLSFRMGTGDIFIHYVNVDLLASGPPDALFDSATNTTGTTSNSFAGAARFGGSGPKIYDYALVSMPYSETAGSGLDDTRAVNLSIPVFYDDNWNQIYNSTFGSATNFTANNSRYSDRQSEWNSLTSATVCVSNYSAQNLTSPCYIDNSSNRIWIRIPHFSGTAPSATGNVVAAATTIDTDTTGGSSGASTTAYWYTTFVPPANQLSEGYSQALPARTRVQFALGTQKHYVGVISVDNLAKTALVNVSSDPQQKGLSLNEEWKVDVDANNYYDVLVKLTNVSLGKATLLIKTINEVIPVPVVSIPEPNVTEQIEKKVAEVTSNWSTAKKVAVSVGILLALAVLVIGVILLIQKINYSKMRNRVKTIEFARK